MNKLRIKRITAQAALLIPLLLFAASCTERISINLDEGYTRLVVDGILTTDTGIHTIKLTKTTSYYYNEPAPGISGARVTLNDGTSEITLRETGEGIYQTDPGYSGIPGRTYTLDIHLAEPVNGFLEYSAVSYMNQGITLDSVKAIFHDDWGKDGYYELGCYVLDPPTTDYYMFKTYKNGQLITDTLSRVLVTDDRFYNGNYTNGIGVGFYNQSMPREKVNPGDILTVESARITRDYYTFITQLQIQSGYQTPLFSGPPSNIAGNISNGAVGFFATYPVSYTSTSISE